MSRAGLIFPALLFALVIVLLTLGYWYYEYAWISFAFPLGVGVVLCALCAIATASTLRRQPATVPEIGEDAPEPLSLVAVAWMFVLAVFLYAFGFVFGPAAYLLACLRANGSSWALSAGIAAASMLVTWGLFIKVMGILLPVAPLWME